MILFFFLIPLLFVNADNNYNFEDDYSLKHYNTYNKIVEYIRKLQRKYPNKMNVVRIGNSTENREIIMAKIKENTNKTNRPIILIDAGMHAREWMSPAVSLYLIHELVANSTNKYMTENFDWFIIPVLNPDGYHYSHTRKRMWRKNRSIGGKCIGVDINRNFNVHWKESEIKSNECALEYAGPTPFSEPESRALRSVALYYKKNIKLYISLHVYGNIVAYPWGWTSKLSLPEHSEVNHKRLAKLVAQAIHKNRGSQYKYGRLGKLLYTSPGTSLDWMYNSVNVPLCFLIEIGNSQFRFKAPEEEILPTSRELFEGFKEFHAFLQTFVNT